jgi:hypothetical protein
MSSKRSVFLFVTFIVGWTGPLLVPAAFNPAPGGQPILGQDVYPIARRYWGEIQQRIESSPEVPVLVLPADVLFTRSSAAPGRFRKASPPEKLSTTHFCYVSMSMQC